MRRALQIVLPFLFVIGSVLVVVAMVRAFSTEAATEQVLIPRAVDVVVARPQSHAARIEATGTVEPDRQVDLVAQVQGRVIRALDGLAPGRPVSRGDVLATIDPRDYRNAVAQAESSLAQAELNLALEEGRAQQAVREWELLRSEAATPLARREPQLAAARAAVDSARAALDTAQLNLERTRVVAPFDGIVISESVEEGQLIGPGAPVVRMIGTDRFRVRVSVPVGALRWLPLPDARGNGGATADVVQPLPGGGSLTASGTVSRLLGELDAQTRTASLLVVLDRPVEGVDVPILPGAFVRVTLHGAARPGLVELPRIALQEDGSVLVADAESTLRRRPVEVAFSTRDHVYVAAGLTDGERVITTPLSLPLEGMALDVQQPVAAAQ